MSRQGDRLHRLVGGSNPPGSSSLEVSFTEWSREGLLPAWLKCRPSAQLKALTRTALRPVQGVLPCGGGMPVNGGSRQVLPLFRPRACLANLHAAHRSASCSGQPAMQGQHAHAVSSPTETATVQD